MITLIASSLQIIQIPTTIARGDRHTLITRSCTQPTQRASFVLSLMLFMSGCITSTDVSRDPRYHIGYTPGQVYVLKSGATVFRDDAGTCTIDLQDKSRTYEGTGMSVMQVLPAGSRIRIDKLLHTIERAPIQGESYIETIVTPLDRTYACKSVRLGNGLSRWTVFQATNGWPTMIGSPDPISLQLEHDANVPQSGP